LSFVPKNCTYELNTADSILLTSFKNKITLLDFWASWCVPCRSAIPKLKNVYAKYKKNGFEIVSISTDNSKDAWQKALIKEKMQWLNLLDNTDKNIRLSNALGIVSLPFYILLNNDGKIIFSTDKTEIMIEHIQLLLGK
jgi:thiol-disulfide isomerase/thioredoxin